MNNEPEIIIIGAAILDILACPVDETVFHNGSTPASEIRMSTGGDALNEATVLACLGKRVQLETTLGRDEAGQYIQRWCREKGIYYREECVRENIVTGINVVLVDREGERRFITNPQGSLRKLALEDICMPFPESAKIVCLASIFVSPLLGVKEMERLFCQAKQQGKILCADMTKRKNGETVEEMTPALNYLDYLFANEEEAGLLTGERTAELSAARLKQAGVGCVVIKAGGRGCYLQDEAGGRWFAPQEKVDCVDTTGAGDSFVGGFLTALLEGKDTDACAQYANLSGGRAASMVGATSWLDFL